EQMESAPCKQCGERFLFRYLEDGLCGLCVDDKKCADEKTGIAVSCKKCAETVLLRYSTDSLCGPCFDDKRCADEESGIADCLQCKTRLESVSAVGVNSKRQLLCPKCDAGQLQQEQTRAASAIGTEENKKPSRATETRQPQKKIDEEPSLSAGAQC